MEDKHIKIWFLIIFVTVMNVGAAASYLGASGKLYKGSEEVKSQMFQASVLNSEAPEERTLPKLRDSQNDEEDMAKKNEAVKESIQRIFDRAKKQEVKSPCETNEMPVLKAGKITGCKKIKN